MGIENVQAVLQAVLTFIQKVLKSRISLFFERAVQELKDKPYATFSAEQQNRVVERWLRDHGSALESSLHERILHSFTGQRDSKKEVPFEELRVLDDDSLNVVMLRARLVNSLMARSRESVVALEVRLEALKQAGAQINAKAFTPGAIADGFIEVLQQLSVPTEMQMFLMEAYSDDGAEMLTGFYKDLNDLLISHGVIPGFKYSVIKTPEPKTKAGQPASSSYGGGTSTGTGGSGSGHEVRAGGTKGDESWAPPWPAISSGMALPADFVQLLDAKLNAMQQALSALNPENWKPGTLRDTFALPPPLSLSPEQEESIDHIEAVFLDLIRDTRISARFRTELNRLILPLMSLRLTDAELFKDPENPVRRFIRQLALLGFRDKETPIQEIEHISLVVGRIVSERALEISSFHSGAEALYTIAKNEVRRQLQARQLSRALLPAAEEKHDIAEHNVIDSHQNVQAALRSMSAGLRLPPVIQHFVLSLLGPWMMIRYQRYGEDSEQMKDCIQLASTFFSLLEPAVSEEDQKQKTQLRQQILEQIAIRVSRSRVPENERRVLLEGMAEYFSQLDSDPSAGLMRHADSDAGSFVSYVDELPVIRAN